MLIDPQGLSYVGLHNSCFFTACVAHYILQIAMVNVLRAAGYCMNRARNILSCEWLVCIAVHYCGRE